MGQNADIWSLILMSIWSDALAKSFSILKVIWKDDDVLFSRRLFLWLQETHVCELDSARTLWSQLVVVLKNIYSIADYYWLFSYSEHSSTRTAFFTTYSLIIDQFCSAFEKSSWKSNFDFYQFCVYISNIAAHNFHQQESYKWAKTILGKVFYRNVSFSSNVMAQILPNFSPLALCIKAEQFSHIKVCICTSQL